MDRATRDLLTDVRETLAQAYHLVAYGPDNSLGAAGVRVLLAKTAGKVADHLAANPELLLTRWRPAFDDPAKTRPQDWYDFEERDASTNGGFGERP